MSGFFHAWLFAFFFWTGLSLGSAFLVMIHHLTGGHWGFVIRRILEAAMAPLPLMALLFVPVFFGLEELYPWAREAVVASDEILQHRTPYMSATGFVVRAILVFGVWIFVCWRLRRLSRQQDETSAAGPGLALRRLSGPALVALPFVATLAYLDWVISLEKHWYSSVFMLLLYLGQTLSALCLALLMAPRFDVLREMTTEILLNQWGNLLLALVLLWSYLMYGQLLIVWMGNLPDEIGWYLRRVETGWVLLLAVIVLFHFIIPFAVLLSREAKKRSGMLVSLSAMLLLIHALFDGWVILPSASSHGAVWFSFLTFPLIGALWCWRFLAALHAVPVLVKNNSQLAVEHE